MTRTVFITGANSGVGLATTRLFLEKGWNVVATARAPSSSSGLQDLVKASGNRLLLHSLDFLAPDSFQPALDAAIAEFTKVDVLVNNAGYGQFGTMEALTMEDYRRQFEVNVFGPICLSKVFLPHFLATADPASPPLIIYVSSGAAHFGLPFMSAYMASKSALNLFVEAVSYELAAISPCPVKVKTLVPHGGIQSTNFSASSNSAAGFDLVGKNPELAQRYGAYATRITQTLGQEAAKSMPVTRPAESIWQAATDGKTKLRYFVAPDDGGETLKRRLAGMREGEDPDDTDERYMNAMREIFA